MKKVDCKKKVQDNASSGNRTRAVRVAGEHSTTEPTMLTGSEGEKLTILFSVVGLLLFASIRGNKHFCMIT